MAIPIGPYQVKRLHRRPCPVCGQPITQGQTAWFVGVGLLDGRDVRAHRECVERLEKPEALREMY